MDLAGRSGAALALVLAAAAWGLGTVVAKRAVADLPPLTLLAIQLASSLVVLAALMRSRGLALRDPSASPLLLRLGLLNPGLGYALSLVGLVSISASLSVLLWALEPLAILLLAAPLLGERTGWLVVGLSGVAIAGLGLIVLEPTTSGDAFGVALTVAGVLCCAVYTIVARRWIASSDSTAQVVLGQQAHALVLAAVAVLALAIAGQPVLPATLTAAGLASAVGSGVLYYAVAYWLYLSGLRQVPASIASASFYLVPVFGVAGGFAFLGERLEPAQWLGAAIVALAVAGILRRTLAGPAPAAVERTAPLSA